MRGGFNGLAVFEHRPSRCRYRTEQQVGWRKTADAPPVVMLGDDLEEAFRIYLSRGGEEGLIVLSDLIEKQLIPVCLEAFVVQEERLIQLGDQPFDGIA